MVTVQFTFCKRSWSPFLISFTKKMRHLSNYKLHRFLSVHIINLLKRLVKQDTLTFYLQYHSYCSAFLCSNLLQLSVPTVSVIFDLRPCLQVPSTTRVCVIALRAESLCNCPSSWRGELPYPLSASVEYSGEHTPLCKLWVPTEGKFIGMVHLNTVVLSTLLID